MRGMHPPKLSIARHMTSVLSFAFVTANLLLWLPLLLLAALVRLVAPNATFQKFNHQMVEFVYRSAVKIDAWWFSRVLGIHFEVEDPADVLNSLTPTQSPVVICNHQSWFDIFLLQTILSSRGPILKFVIKVELLWVPVLGWVCLALNFPRLRRKVDAQSRSEDLKRVRSASLVLGTEPGGLLIFPEGTRFSEDKRKADGSPYQNLLKPRPGGLSMIQQSMPVDTQVVDVSIGYRPGETDCWRCMSGSVDKIRVKIDAHHIQEVAETGDWLNERWLAKDSWLAQAPP